MTGLSGVFKICDKQVVGDYTPVFCSLGKQIKIFPGLSVFSVSSADVVVKNPSSLFLYIFLSSTQNLDLVLLIQVLLIKEACKACNLKSQGSDNRRIGQNS